MKTLYCVHILILLCEFTYNQKVFSEPVLTGSSLKKEYLQKYSKYLSKNSFDSAFIFLDSARHTGMPKDSFYLLYADIFINRGILDTALALNYYIKDSDDNNLRTNKFKQRFLIFSMLDLTSEANQALDSLGQDINIKRAAYFHLPRLSIGINGSYQKSREHTAESYPITESQRSISLLYDEKKYDIGGKIEWDLPFFMDRLFTFGVDYSSGNPSTKNLFTPDSFSHNFSFLLRYNGYSSFSPMYKFTRKINSRNEFSSQNAILLSWAKVTKSNATECVSLMGSVDYMNSHISNQTYYLQGLYEKKFSVSTLGFTLDGYINSSDKIESNIVLSNVYIIFIDDVKSTHPVHYYKDSLTVAIPYNPRNGIILTKTYFTDNKKDTSITALRYSIPKTAAYISPSVDFSRELLAGINFYSTFQYSLAYYITPYKWTNMGINDTFLKDNRLYLAYNKSDGQLYYAFNYQNATADETFSSQPFQLQQIKKTRIDNTFTLSFSFGHSIQKTGSFSLGGAISKNFSTLGHESPIEIADWYWNLGTSLIFNYPFRK